MALVLIIWNIFCWDFPFFWDNILNSKLAHWYLETGFSRLMVPEKLDAGHPPFFNIYLAFCWKILGKSLWVAHLAMLPFLWGICWQWWKLCRRFLSAGMVPWGMLILLLEPTFLAQSSMLSPDVALVCFLLLGVNAVIEERKIWLVVATVGMAAVTFRGILLVPAIWLVELWWHGDWKNVRIAFFRTLWYLPVAGLVLAWLLYHWQVQGWLLAPPAETYGGHREAVGLGGILWNFGIAGWRFLDFGRVFLWIFLGVALLFRRGQLKSSPQFRALVGLFLISTIWLLALLLPFSNPIGHRYFTFHFLLLALGALLAVDLLETHWRRWLVPALLSVGLVGGHFWIYPDKVAQGWDASLAHLPYFGNQRSLDHCDFENRVICTDFPLLAEKKYRLVEDLPETGRFVSKDDWGWENCSCIFQSNISNGFSDAELEELRGSGIWSRGMRTSSAAVYVQEYRRVSNP